MFSLRAQTVVLERDPDISDMVNAVSPENLQQLVEKLASFGTRHTLSDTLSDTRGIGAARRWIKAELERYARASGGRMRVEYDTYLPERSEEHTSEIQTQRRNSCAIFSLKKTSHQLNRSVQLNN